MSSAVIRGATLFEPADLFYVYRDHLGQPITRERVSAVVTALADHYEAAGYPRPRVSVDDELVELGVLRINVFEARIAEVSIGGDPGPHRERLERLGAALAGGEPLSREALRHTLSRMRSLPGLTVTAVTEPATDTPNVYRLDVDADYKPLSGTLRVTNRGTEDVGPHLAIGQLVANGVLGGRTSAGLLFAAAAEHEELRGLGALASASLGGRGATLSFTGFRTRAKPLESSPDAMLRYVRDRATLRYSRPLFAGSEASTALVLGLEATDLTIERAGAELRDERLRMLKLGFTRNRRRGGVEYGGTLDVVKGLDAMNSGLVASDLASDPRRADFLLLRLSFVRLASFASSWQWRFDSYAQQTAYTLPYTERFKIGGERLGRGFEVASVAGDQGFGGKLELRRDLPRAPPVLGRASLYGFYDVGAAFSHDAPGRESAATAGLGFGVRGERVVGSVEVAKPLTHPDVEGSEDARVFFELSLRL